MRVAAVVLAALVLAPAAFAHAELSPVVLPAGKTTSLVLTVPTESETAATVRVVVSAAPSLGIRGQRRWHGRTRGTLHLRLTAHPSKAGDYPVDVAQTYSDGRVVDWSGPESSNTPAPVLHVQGQSTSGRDRVIIIVVVAAALLGLGALRRRGRESA